MKMGTRSLLFGVHQFLIHPVAVAVAWTKLYGFPTDIRLWAAFILHDIGYWGKSDMDGEDGERHPELGAAIMGKLFGKKWGEFTLLHSRFYARRRNQPYSRLAVADKLANTVLPAWLYLTLACVTGEIAEYMNCTSCKEGAGFRSRGARTGDVWLWYAELRVYLSRWAAEHKNVNDPLLPAMPALTNGDGETVPCR